MPETIPFKPLPELPALMPGPAVTAERSAQADPTASTELSASSDVTFASPTAEAVFSEDASSQTEGAVATGTEQFTAGQQTTQVVQETTSQTAEATNPAAETADKSSVWRRLGRAVGRMAVTANILPNQNPAEGSSKKAEVASPEVEALRTKLVGKVQERLGATAVAKVAGLGVDALFTRYVAPLLESKPKLTIGSLELLNALTSRERGSKEPPSRLRRLGRLALTTAIAVGV